MDRAAAECHELGFIDYDIANGRISEEEGQAAKDKAKMDYAYSILESEDKGILKNEPQIFHDYRNVNNLKKATMGIGFAIPGLVAVNFGLYVSALIMSSKKKKPEEETGEENSNYQPVSKQVMEQDNQSQFSWTLLTKNTEEDKKYIIEQKVIIKKSQEPEEDEGVNK